MAATKAPRIIPRAEDSFCLQLDKTGLPDWYLKAVLIPFEEAQCRIPAYRNQWASDYTVIDRKTGNPADYTIACLEDFKSAAYVFLANHFFAFNNISSEVNGDFIEDSRYRLLFSHLALYCSPLVVLVLMVGLHVVRKVLAKSQSSHLYIYHYTLVFVDMFVFFLSTLIPTGLAPFLRTPGCLAHPLIALNLSAYTIIRDIALQALYCFGNLIQALLALDRMLALYAPIAYRSFASKRAVTLCILAVFLINTAETAVELVFNEPHAMAYYIANGLNQVKALQNILLLVQPKLRILQKIRLGMFVATIALQLVCCVAIFVKLWWRKHKIMPALASGNGNQQQSGSISLTPCYLLLGTCVLNSVGAGFEAAGLLGDNFLLSEAGGSYEERLALKEIADLRWIMIPICNSCGMLVHLLVSRQYRAEAAKCFRRICRRGEASEQNHQAPVTSHFQALHDVEASNAAGERHAGGIVFAPVGRHR